MTQRRGWVIGGSIVAVVFVGWAAFQAVGLASREERTVRRTYPVDGLDALRVSTDSGDVSVVADSEERIRVEIRVVESLGGASTDDDRGDGRLSLSAQCPPVAPFCSVDYVVHVPRRFDVVAVADNGDVIVRGSAGVVGASSDNGDVTASGLAGASAALSSSNGDVRADGVRSARIRATSDNGDVRVGFAVAPNRVEAASDNGDVRVELPRGKELYAATATSDNGDTEVEVRTDPASQRRVVASSDNGDVAVAYR